jgi:hypothetical protein
MNLHPPDNSTNVFNGGPANSDSDKRRVFESVEDAPDKEIVPDGELDTGTSRIKVIDVIDFMCLELPPRGNILAPWLPQQGLAMVFAPRGVGKTHFSLGVAYAVASGGEFLFWKAPTPRNVLFLDGEMPAVTLQERIAHIIERNEKEATALFNIITPDLQPEVALDIETGV